MLLNKNIENIQFIRDHYNDDLSKLALNRNKYKSFDIDNLIKEISSRKKLEKKMPDWASDFELAMPNPINVEQSSGYLTAKFKAGMSQYANSVDLTCGFGIDSFFMAAKSGHHICIEPDTELNEIVTHNFKMLGLNNCDIINSSAEHFIKRNDIVFDLVYIDPSRRTKNGGRKILLNDYQPDLENIFHDLKRISRRLVVKLSPMLDITSLLLTFPEINDIYVIAVEGECKELLLVFDFLSHVKGVYYHAIELQENKFEYIFEKDEELVVNYGVPHKYLYDVHPAIMKTGFHDNYAMSLGLMKINKNCHLYTSDTLAYNFSGKIYELIDVCKPQQKELENIPFDMKAVVIRKDFPLAVEDIRKKFKISEGINTTIFAVKLLNEKNAFLISKRIR